MYDVKMKMGKVYNKTLLKKDLGRVFVSTDYSDGKDMNCRMYFRLKKSKIFVVHSKYW